MHGDLPLGEGDAVELLPGVLVPPHTWLTTGIRGRVVITDDRAEVTVLFDHHGLPIRIHRRWLQRVEPPVLRRRRRWGPP
jgi:hypothetical protein